MRKYILVFLSTVFIALTSYAKHVPIEKATQVAHAYFKKLSKSQNFEISDVYIESVENTNTFYIFSFAPTGFVIVTADDGVQPILGYSVSGSFDKNNIPVQLKGWLKQYSEGIYDAVTLRKSYDKKSKEWEQILSGEIKSTKSLVTPLCSTLWDQTCWYNELCPLDTLGTCGHAVTGCVATAIAQVMKFWNYPVHGQGTHSYVSQWHGLQTADFGAATYLWDSMPPVLTQSNLAVATLMYHVGVSVDMDYYDNSSGSNLYWALTSLPNYFKYSHNIEFKYRLNYSDSAWIELMKSELNEGRPILYQGLLDALPVGHAWVCDGYDNNNFLHFNWGQMGNEGYYETGNFIWNNSNEAVIKVMPIASCDIALRNFISPVSATFSAPSTIKVRISNYDTLPHTNIPVSYMVDGGTPVTEIISAPLAALSDTVYEFIQSYDFTPNPGHVYNVKVYSDLACDGYRDNDTLYAPVENVACVNPPYSMGFEPSENMNGWVMLDANGDGNRWNIGVGGHSQPTCVYYNGGSTQGNDWLFSRCLQFENNKMYKLSYFYNGMGQYWPHKLSIFVGDQQNIAGMTNLLNNDSNIINNTYQKKEIYFTVPATGSYYIGWHCYSDPDNYSLALDDINITEQIATDVGLVSTNLPLETCNLQQENIEVVIRNFCSAVLNNIPVSFSINGGTPVTETITTPIAVGDSLIYTFSTPADLSSNGLHNVSIYTSLPNDTLYNNDTIKISVTNHTSINPPYTMRFEPSEDFSGWKIYDINNDNYKWTIKTTGGRSQPYCIRYDYSSMLPADDWFVSSCINLTSSQNYKLGFWYKAEASQWPEKLKVFIGNGQDTLSLNNQLLDFPNIVNTTYQYAEAVFTVPADGLYYIGWYCYSDAVMFNLYVDDISLDITTSEQGHKYGSEYQVFPNPCKDEITILHINDAKNEIKYEIFNTSGKQITGLSSKNNKVGISTRELSNGVYVLKITSGEGVVVKKLIKQ